MESNSFLGYVKMRDDSLGNCRKNYRYNFTCIIVHMRKIAIIWSDYCEVC